MRTSAPWEGKFDIWASVFPPSTRHGAVADFRAARVLHLAQPFAEKRHFEHPRPPRAFGCSGAAAGLFLGTVLGTEGAAVFAGRRCCCIWVIMSSTDRLGTVGLPICSTAPPATAIEPPLWQGSSKLPSASMPAAGAAAGTNTPACSLGAKAKAGISEARSAAAICGQS